MATPSYKWYQTSVLAWMWNEEAIQQSWSEIPWYSMFPTNTQTTKTESTDAWNKDREVEVWLWVKLVQPMSDMEKTEYVNSLTDDQYRQMQKYKNQWYSFEASRTLLENSEWLANPTAVGTEKYNPKGNFFKNMVAWAYDSVTWLPRFLSNNLAKAVWWTAKKLWADEDKVNELVQSYIDFGENEMSWKALWANTNSATYKITKTVWDIAQVAAWEWLAKEALKWTQALNKINQVKNSGLLGKMAVWAAEWAADMWLYNIVSESELPTWKDLAVWAALWAALPVAWAWLKAAKKAIKTEAWAWAEKLIRNINKISESKNQKFIDTFGEDAGKVMNDRWLRTRQDVQNWHISNIDKVDNALDSIQWTFKDPIVDDVLAETVEFATKTADENLNRLLQLQEKAANEWLTMSEINEVKRYFEWHTKFAYGKSQDAIKSSKATNLDTRLREWQRKVAAENGLENLAQLNRETQMSKYILNNSKDVSKGLLWAIDPTDELLAIHYGWLDRALATYVTKSVLKSAKFQSKVVDILNRLAWHQNVEAVLADLNAISKVNTEKEFDALMKKRELGTALPAPTEWAVNEAWYNILKQGEDMIAKPNWETIVKDTITEIK